MSGLMLWVALTAGVVSDQPLTYEEAYAAASKARKPMLVLVGADWCPACRVMKHTTMPELVREGKLSRVSYTVVDVDASPRLGSQWMRSNSIPQLILCLPFSNGWRRFYLDGSQSREAILSMIRNGLEDQARELAAARPATAIANGDSTADE